MIEDTIAHMTYRLCANIASNGIRDGLTEDEIVEKLIRHMYESDARSLIAEVKNNPAKYRNNVFY